MDEQFTFWYVAVDEVQLGLEGKEFHKDVLLEGHIVHGGRLLCKESMEVLKNRVKKKYEAQTVKGLPFKSRQGRVKICPDCTVGYMTHPDSSYVKWVQGKPKVPATREVVSPHVKV